MFSEPEDPAVRTRMRGAFAAAARLGCTPQPQAAAAWGHSGRTLGATVTTDAGRAWLRVMETLVNKQGGKLWTGNQEATTVLPAGIPRPHLFVFTDWVWEDYAYRAELSSYVPASTCSP